MQQLTVNLGSVSRAVSLVGYLGRVSAGYGPGAGSLFTLAQEDMPQRKVDATSLLSVFSLDLTRSLVLSVPDGVADGARLIAGGAA